MDAAMQTMVRNIEEKTGKNIDHWIAFVRKHEGRKHGEIVQMLKADHGFGHGHANMVVHMARGAVAEGDGEGERLVEAMFSGKKAAHRAAYDKLCRAIESFGSDVEVSPKKTYVSFRRKKQFALVQPSTATRLDVGINLKGVAPSGRLESADGFNAMCTHRVRTESVDHIDDELISWVRKAYDAAG